MRYVVHSIHVPSVVSSECVVLETATVSVQGQGLVHHLKAVVHVTWGRHAHTKFMYVNKSVQTTENYMKTVLNTSNSLETFPKVFE